MSDASRPRGLQLAGPLCPSPTPRVYSNSCPLSRWCHPTISSSVVPFSSCVQSVSSLHQVAKVLVFQLQHKSFQWIFSTHFFRIDWFDLFAGQGTLKSLLQHHSSKVWILRYSASFMVQLSYPYMTTGKTIALTRQTFVGNITSLLFNILSRFVIVSLLRSKRFLISWLQSLSAVILDPKEIKSVIVFYFSPIYLPWSNGTRCHDLSFMNVEF